MWHVVNLFLWLAMSGVAFLPSPGATYAHECKFTAGAGLIFALLWQHSAVRGFLKRRQSSLPPVG